MLMSLTPAILLLLLLATACAALAHVLLGRRWRQLPFFWLTAFVGCMLAFGLQFHLPLALPHPAGVPVLEAVLLAWLMLIVVSRLRV
jgi:drug/metabolite transporter (DMT)-like permease